MRYRTDPEDLGWQETKDGSVEVRSGAARTSDMVGVSLALGAAAETGTVLMVADGATPTSLNFVPDVEIIVVSKKDIEAGMEGCWQKLREWKNAPAQCRGSPITSPARPALPMSKQQWYLVPTVPAVCIWCWWMNRHHGQKTGR